MISWLLTPEFSVNWYPWIAAGVALLHPGILRVVGIRQRLRAAGQHVEIIRGIAGRAYHRMIALGDQHHVVIAREHQRIDRKASLLQWRLGVGIDPLVGIPLGLLELIEVYFLQVGF